MSVCKLCQQSHVSYGLTRQELKKKHLKLYSYRVTVLELEEHEHMKCTILLMVLRLPYS